MNEFMSQLVDVRLHPDEPPIQVSAGCAPIVLHPGETVTVPRQAVEQLARMRDESGSFLRHSFAVVRDPASPEEAAAWLLAALS